MLLNAHLREKMAPLIFLQKFKFSLQKLIMDSLYEKLRIFHPLNHNFFLLPLCGHIDTDIVIHKNTHYYTISSCTIIHCKLSQGNCNEHNLLI